MTRLSVCRTLRCAASLLLVVIGGTLAGCATRTAEAPPPLPPAVATMSAPQPAEPPPGTGQVPPPEMAAELARRGEAALRAAPPRPPAPPAKQATLADVGLPAYPGATAVQNSATETAANAAVVAFETKDPPAQVLAWYRTKLADRSMTEVESLGNAAAPAATLSETLPDGLRQITITQTAGKTQIMLVRIKLGTADGQP